MPSQSLIDIANYHTDAEASLRLYFSKANPGYDVRFFANLESEVADQLVEHIDENEMRSVLVLMARVDAAFRVDFDYRARHKKADPLSIIFRKLHKKRGERVRLNEDILETWQKNLDDPLAKSLISELRGAFRFRHWLAHGRFWKPGRKYDYQTIYLMADTVLHRFSLYE
jgi:hypothetical protein